MKEKHELGGAADRRLLLLGIAGSILWLLADIVLGYLPGGIAKSGFMSDAQTLAAVLSGAPVMFVGLAACCGKAGS